MNYNDTGALEHSWAIIKQGAEMPMPYTDADADKLYYTSGHLKPSEQKTGSLAPLKRASTPVFMPVSGHYPVMQGRLVVQ